MIRTSIEAAPLQAVVQELCSIEDFYAGVRLSASTTYVIAENVYDSGIMGYVGRHVRFWAPTTAPEVRTKPRIRIAQILGTFLEPVITMPDIEHFYIGLRVGDLTEVSFESRQLRAVGSHEPAAMSASDLQRIRLKVPVKAIRSSALVQDAFDGSI